MPLPLRITGKAIAGIVMGSTGIAVGAILLAVNLLLFGFSFTSPVTGLPSPTT